MRLKFIEDSEFKGWYRIEEEFKDTDTVFHEVLGFIFNDELGYHWNIEPDYSGIIDKDQLQQIVNFIKKLEGKK